MALLAFGPLLFASPAYSDEVSEAKAALDNAQLVASQLTEAKIAIDAEVITATEQVATDQAAVDAANTALAEATTQSQGLSAEVYNVLGQNNAPYIPEGSTPIAEVTVANIQFNWGGGAILSDRSEDVIVKFEGYITRSTQEDVLLYAPADDGVRLYLDDTLVVNDWYDKGGGGSVSQPVSFQADVPKKITMFYYENGGGAHVALYWAALGQPFEIVPPAAFSTVETSPELAAALAAADATLVASQDELAALIVEQGQVTSSLETAIAAIPPLQAAYDAALEAAKPKPQPVPEPTEEPVVPTPTPEATEEPEPTPVPEEPEATPEPTPEPEPTVEPVAPEEPVEEPIEPVVEPITEEQIVAELAAEAEADDPELPAEIASIPLVGEALGAVLEVFNDIGNIGADMAPEVREKAQDAVVASVIVGQVASSAAAAAATASASAASTRKIK